VCGEFGWDIHQWWATPPYWRRVFSDLLYARRLAENERAERERRQQRGR
jgi:hypothetical protein